MNVSQKLDALAELVENARSMPMSASCVLNRAEVLELIDDVRETLPSALADAEAVLARRDSVTADGAAKAEELIDAAYAERARLVSESEVYRQAEIEAERVVHEATVQADRTRGEVDDYVDARLANFEVVLQKTLTTVGRGRARLSGRHEQDTLATGAEAAGEVPEDDQDDERE